MPTGQRWVQSSGAIRLRTLFEVLLLATVGYVALQVGPAVILRTRFMNEMELAANSPVEMTAVEIKHKLQSTAEGMGLTLLSEDLHVIRDQKSQRTTIDARYDIHIRILPSFVYVWKVRDEAEGYYY